MRSPKHFSTALILFATCCIYGCDNTIEMSNPTFESGDVEVSGSTSRESYDWPVGTKFFEPETPSRFKFFDATRERVKAFLDQAPFKQKPTEFFLPDGLSQKMIELAYRVKAPPDEPKSVLKVPVSSDSAVFAISKKGDKIAICDAGEILIWNTDEGKQEKAFPSTIENPERLVFDASGDSLFIANSNSIGRVDLETTQTRLSSNKFTSPIVQFAIATDVNKLAIRCKEGEIYVTDEALVKFTAYPNSAAKSDVAISSSGDRIAFWNDTIPTEVEVKDLEFGRRDIVEQVKYSGGERRVTCGRFTTQWIHGRQVFHWWHNELGVPFNNRSWRRDDFCWNPIALFHRSPNRSGDYHSVLGFREAAEGGLEQVIADVNCITGKSSRPQLIPTEAKSLCLNLAGSRYAFQVGREIQVADRVVWQLSLSDLFVADSFLISMQERAPEQLDHIGEFILKNDFWWEYGLSSQDAYTQFAEELGELWYELQTAKQPNEETKLRLELLDTWLEKGSELALLTSAFRRRVVAWQALGGMGVANYNYAGRDTFDKELKKIRAEISPLLRKPNPNNAALVLLLFYHLGSLSDLKEVDELLERSITQNPECFEPFIMAAPMLVKRWRGENNDLNAFIRETCSLYGPEFGPMLYTRLHVRTSWVFPGAASAILETRYSRDRIITGLAEMARRNWLDIYTFSDSFYLFYASISPKHIRYKTIDPVIKEYCRQNAYSPRRNTNPHQTVEKEFDNPTRYIVLRYTAIIFDKVDPKKQ